MKENVCAKDQPLSEESRRVVRIVRRVTWIGFWVNAVLMVFKIGVGLWGHSDALVADGVHSFSDFATDILVIVVIGIAYKTADADHPYGHGKYETLASLMIGVSLAIVAFGIGLAGAKTIFRVIGGEILDRPDMLTLWVALAGIFSKEFLYRYTYLRGKQVGSASLMANAWHHRSDAISSLATVIGIGASIFLGEQWRILDPVASVVIAVFILVSAWKICSPAVKELLEFSLPESETKRIEEIIGETPGVLSYHRLRSRRNGHASIIDVHIKVDGDISVRRGHSIASDVEKRLRDNFGADIITNIHVEPLLACPVPSSDGVKK